MTNARAAVRCGNGRVSRRIKHAPLTHRDVGASALCKTGCAEDSLPSQFLTRYGELKSCEPEQMHQWLEALTLEQLLQVRDVFETASIDCSGDVNSLTSQPFEAAATQMKLVPEFWSDGSPLASFRRPRLNTLNAIDDALGALFVPALRGAETVRGPQFTIPPVKRASLVYAHTLRPSMS